VRRHAEHPQAINHRLQELDREWDTERTLEANASALGFIGVMLGAFASPWWLLLPATVTAFLFQHAIQGWRPPVPILRRLGFRTEREINIERNALKALRGDYARSDQMSMTTTRELLATLYRQPGYSGSRQSRPKWRQIITAPDCATWAGRRDRALFTLLYNTVARVYEVTDLKVGDVVLDVSPVVHLHGKG